MVSNPFDFHVRHDCRLCGGDLKLRVEFGGSPLANELLDDPRKSLKQERFPLYLSSCTRCGHVQMPVVVNPDRLFRNYPYVSGTSPVFVDHLRRQASQLAHRHNLRPNDLVVEIGSNDGTLLKHFEALGATTVGVDPALNITARANELGSYTIPEFFTPRVAQQIHDRFGDAKLVVANNVFAHADDLHSIVDGVYQLIGERGHFVFEVAYLMDMVKAGIWDTVYHEHLAFHHLRPLIGFFQRHGMEIVNAEKVPTQGGSMRVTVQRSTPHTRVNEGLYEMLAQEPEGEVNLTHLERKIFQLRMELHNRDVMKGTCAIYGVAAKAATLCSVLGLGSEQIEYAVDQNPLKHGKFIPGTQIPIFPVEHLHKNPPTTVLVTAWNFIDSIIANTPKASWRWVAPFPALRVY
jgi:SAM-dependent methyltransferase